MPQFTLILDFLAPVPVNHRVRIDYYMLNQGLMRPDFQPDMNHPVITDLDAGIRYADSSHYSRWREFVEQPPTERPLHATYFGIVQDCEVTTCGGHTAYVYTRLNILPTEPPA